MKRSEALSKIKSNLDNILRRYLSNEIVRELSVDSVIWIDANDILDDIEDMGMLPPAIDDTYAKKLAEKYPDLIQWCDHHKCYKYIPGQWEVHAAPKDVADSFQIIKYGEYSIVKIMPRESNKWEPEDA